MTRERRFAPDASQAYRWGLGVRAKGANAQLDLSHSCGASHRRSMQRSASRSGRQDAARLTPNQAARVARVAASSQLPSLVRSTAVESNPLASSPARTTPGLRQRRAGAVSALRRPAPAASRLGTCPWRRLASLHLASCRPASFDDGGPFRGDLASRHGWRNGYWMEGRRPRHSGG